MTSSATVSSTFRLPSAAARPARSGIASDLVQLGLALVMVPFTLPWLIVGRGLPPQDADD